MGPRNRRRLRVGGIAGVVVVLSVLAVVVTSHRSSGDSGSATTGQAAHHRSTTASRATHLYYGMTPRQVRHFAGRAEKVRGSCWYYTPARAGSGTKVGALNVGFPGTPSMTSNQIKLCFYAGVLSFEYLHWRTPEGWRWTPANF